MTTNPTPPSPPVDLKDVQGDIIDGIPKRVEDFIFFTIKDVPNFRRAVGSEALIKLVTTAEDIRVVRDKLKDHKAKQGGHRAPLIPLSAVNIAFTQSGLSTLGISDDLADDPFKQGQLARAGNILADRGETVNNVFNPAWLEPFKRDIHGLVLIAGDSRTSVDETVNKVERVLGHLIHTVLLVHGKVRPGDQKGHEHFGYLDGVSSPALKDIVSPLPGQRVVDPGVLLIGQPGDPNAATRPSWAKNGSFLAYRHLQQFVPEFDKFKRDNALNPLELGVDQGAELLGSRLFGRWKSGAPTMLTPLKDDPELAADPQRNNNFTFAMPAGQDSQLNCPFAAHIRKTNPRSPDLPDPAVAARSIHRAGIAFGPEVTESEHKNNKTEHDRGLAFVCYQSTISLGFEFQQQLWANNKDFVHLGVGQDPVIGQNGNADRAMTGFNPAALATSLPFNFEFVQSKGGAYFFAPSISALENKIGTK